MIDTTVLPLIFFDQQFYAVGINKWTENKLNLFSASKTSYSFVRCLAKPKSERPVAILSDEALGEGGRKEGRNKIGKKGKRHQIFIYLYYINIKVGVREWGGAGSNVSKQHS